MKKVSTVFYVSVAILLLLVIIGVVAPSFLENMTSIVQVFITDAFGWYYLIIVAFFLIVCIYLLVSPVGRIKLGKQEDKPEFSRISWLAMLFSAGMGIGLVFYGTAEPLSHYAISSPTGELATNQWWIILRLWCSFYLPQSVHYNIDCYSTVHALSPIRIRKRYKDFE